MMSTRQQKRRNDIHALEEMVGTGLGEEGFGVEEGEDELEGLELEGEEDEPEGLEEDEEDIWKEKGEVVKVDMKPRTAQITRMIERE